MFSCNVPYYINNDIQNMIDELKVPMGIDVSISRLSIEDDSSDGAITL